MRSAKWDHEQLRQWHERSVYTELSDDESCWDVDDTGFLKQGSDSVGVQRQYTGTAGKTTNCQIGVCLAFSSYKGYAITDFRLYLPESWLKDSERCRKAGIPEDVVFQTKARLVQEMLAQALANGYRASCLTADADYGKAPYLRAFLQKEQLAFALGIQKKLHVHWLKGKLRPLRLAGGLRSAEMSLEAIAREVKATDWLRLPLPGSQGPSSYEWAQTQIALDGKPYGLLMRRLGEDIRFFLTWSPEPRDFLYWVRQIKRRWDVERCFQEAKQEVGLDEYQIRLWTSWHRHILLALVLVWVLAKLKLQFSWEKWTLPQIRQLMRIPWLEQGIPAAHSLQWLHWKRQHNFKATKSHWKRARQALFQLEAA